MDDEKKNMLRAQYTIDSSRDAIFWLDSSGALVYVNQTSCSSLGYTRDELLTKTVFDIDPLLIKEDWATHWDKTREMGFYTLETQHITKGGKIYPVEITINFIEFAGQEYHCSFARDISRRKELEEKFRQSHKMDAIGQLAGGIAHDFNNLLTVINGYAELILKTLDQKSPIFKQVRQICRAGNRAASLTGQLLAFSRKQVLRPKIFDANCLLREMEKLLHRIIGENIELFFIYDKDLTKIKADPGQIEQVILNLVVNARDAMADVGKITIKTLNVELPRDYTGNQSEIVPGRYVMFSVIDTGVGMDPELQKHVFEPFFTTKGQGKGTGLGLSTVYGIVKQSRGYIEVYSEPGHGTTIDVYFPAAGTRERLDVRSIINNKDPVGSETILIVEDDDSVRDLTAISLKNYGYTVISVKDPREALRKFEEFPGSVHMLLTDVVMPNMSGWGLAEELTRRQPRLKLLFMSGYTVDKVAHHGELPESINYIQKPFSPDSLAGKVRSVLDAQN